MICQPQKFRGLNHILKELGNYPNTDHLYTTDQNDNLGNPLHLHPRSCNKRKNNSSPEIQTLGVRQDLKILHPKLHQPHQINQEEYFFE